jgi:Zn-dependent membrane protease YugP
MNVFGLWAFLGTMALSLWAVWRVKSAYAKYSQVPSSSGLSGAEVAAHILQRAGIGGVEIVQSSNLLTDHYDPMNRRVCQPGGVYFADHWLVHPPFDAHVGPALFWMGRYHAIQPSYIAG